MDFDFSAGQQAYNSLGGHPYQGETLAHGGRVGSSASGMVAEPGSLPAQRKGDGHWQYEMARAFSLQAEPREPRPVSPQLNIPTGRHRYKETLQRTSSRTPGTRGRSQRRLSEIEHDASIADEELERRFAAIEATQRSTAMAVARTKEETSMLAQKLDKGLSFLGNKIDTVHRHLTNTCNELNTKVLVPHRQIDGYSGQELA